MMSNHHLNVFRFYNESSNQEFIENNLSRAFALTLKNNNLFLNEYLKSIVSDEDYKYLFGHFSNDDELKIDLQIDTDSIKGESYRTVYAVALTSNRKIDFSNFLTLQNREKKNITDILILIKDIAIIIEVKRTAEDCKQQLFDQVYSFIKIAKPVSTPWQSVIRLMEKVSNIERISGKQCIFLSDFIQLSEIRNPHWFEPKPFAFSPFSTKLGEVNYENIVQRLTQILGQSKFELLPYNDRLGIAIPYNWAREILVSLRMIQNRNYIVFGCWPGNTKSQGYHVYDRFAPDWMNKKILVIDGKLYETDIAYNVKLCHFNKFITGFTFRNSDLKDNNRKAHTPNNFRGQSGKWEENDWNKLEFFFDDYLKPEYDWRKKCDWQGCFLNTDRSYLTMSLGFEVFTFVPYNELQEIDKNEDDISQITAKINEICEGLINLISAT